MKMLQWQNEDLAPITAEVIDVEHVHDNPGGGGKKNSSHIEYVMVVKKGAQIWTVMRRYSEFRSCFSKLRQTGEQALCCD
jgi:hypothetical protein